MTTPDLLTLAEEVLRKHPCACDEPTCLNLGCGDGNYPCPEVRLARAVKEQAGKESARWCACKKDEHGYTPCPWHRRREATSAAKVAWLVDKLRRVVRCDGEAPDVDAWNAINEADLLHSDEVLTKAASDLLAKLAVAESAHDETVARMAVLVSAGETLIQQARFAFSLFATEDKNIMERIEDGRRAIDAASRAINEGDPSARSLIARLAAAEADTKRLDGLEKWLRWRAGSKREVWTGASGFACTEMAPAPIVRVYRKLRDAIDAALAHEEKSDG